MARSNQGYWLDRQQELDKAMEKDEQVLNKRLLDYYRNESNRLTREIASYYQRYGEKDVLEYRAMAEGLSDADRQLLYTDLNEFVKKYPQYADYVPISTSIYQLDRLQGLQASIQLQSVKIGAYENEQLERHFSKQAKRYVDNSAKSLGFGDSFYTENPDIIRKVVYTKWNDGTDFSTRIWNNRQKLTQTLQSDIASAIARGDSYDRISKQIAEKFERVNANNIRRLVFTEDTFVREQANKEVFGQDFEQYTLNVVQDGKTCDTCRALDGKVFSYKDATSGLNFPPLHPWCRCYATPKLPATPEELDNWVDDYAHRHGDSSTAFSRKVLEKIRAQEQGFTDWSSFKDFSDNVESGRDFYRRYMTLTDAEKKKLTQKRAEYLENYTREGFVYDNYYLRGGKKFKSKEQAKKVISEVLYNQDTLSQYELKEDVVLYRRMDTDAVSHFLKIPRNQIGNRDMVETAKGQNYTDPAFMSTSFADNPNFGNIKVKIYAPKGTKGLYAEPYSYAPNEHEVLLKDGTTLNILDIVYDSNGNVSELVTTVIQS